MQYLANSGIDIALEDKTIRVLIRCN